MKIIRVLFASQTGTAEQVAKRIRRDLIRKLPGQLSSDTGSCVCLPVSNLDQALHLLCDQDCTRSNARKVIWIIVCSTTGDGEEPDNMKRFWRFLLRRNLPIDLLEPIDYAVFGLGDSSYPKYNFVAKKLWKRLQQLGARSLLNRGDGDDQHYLGYNGALAPWLKELWKTLRTTAGINIEISNSAALTLLPPENSIEIVDDNIGGVNRPHPPSLDNKQFILAKVFDNKRITAEDHFQDVRHIELKLPSKILYRPGDILQIMPENRKEDVDELINLLNWQDFADGSIIRAIISGENEVIMLTVRQWLVHLLDAFSPPKDEYFFELLYHFATDPIEKERLYEFTSPEGQEDLYDYCYRARRTAFEILTDFRSVRIPLKYLLDLFPMMRPRDFSISNYNQFTGSSNNNTVTITAGILQYNTIMKKSRIGLCSGYLCRIKPQDLIRVRVKPGQMKFPDDCNLPVIMLAPGLGVAPMRSFIHYRNSLLTSVGQTAITCLFYGCRFENKDFLYKDELESLHSKGGIQLFVAFSRDEPRHRHQYVQDVLFEQRRLINSLLEQGAQLFICGDSKQMPSDVMRVLKEIIKEFCPDKDVDQYVNELRRSKRIQTETW